MRRSHLFVLGATLVCALRYAPICQAADPRIERIFEDWRERSKGIDSVEYVVKGKSLFEKGSRTHHDSLPPGTVGPVPSEDLWGKANGACAFDFKTGRFRVISDGDVFSLIDLKPVPDWVSCLFDGNELVVYTPRERNPRIKSPFQPELIINRTRGTGGYLGVPVRTLLAAHGIFSFGWEPPTKRQLQFNEDDYQIEFAAEEKIGDRPVTVLRFTPTDYPELACDVSIDVERQSAILDVATLIRGRTSQEVRIEVENVEGRWLPKRIKSSGFSRNVPAQRTDYVEYEVTERRFNPKLRREDFQAPRKPGTVVHDKETGKDQRIGPDGKSLVPLERPRGRDLKAEAGLGAKVAFAFRR